MALSRSLSIGRAYGGCLGGVEQRLDRVADRQDLRLDLRALVRDDRGGDDRARDATRTTERLLRGNEHVRHVLVLAQQRQMQQDLERVGVSSHDDELRLATVEGLGGCMWCHQESSMSLALSVARNISLSFSLSGERGARDGRGGADIPSLAPFLSCL